MKKITLLISLALLLAGAVTAAIYKWVDEEGKVHYGDRPTPERQAEQIEIKQGPSEKEIQQSRERAERILGEQRRREEPQEVFGTVVLGFAPTALAVMPEPPIELTLLFKPVGGGAAIKHRINDPAPDWVVVDGDKPKAASTHQNFMISLRPGRYEISEVIAQSKSFMEKPFTIAKHGPAFTVPEGGCAYVGRIGYTYVRLPPGSLAQAKAAMKMMSKDSGKPRSFLYLTTGALTLTSMLVDEPKESEQTHGNAILTKALENGCITDLAKF